MALTVRGPVAEVRWAYYVAATVGPWTVSSASGAMTMTGTLKGSDAYRLTQRPLTFVVTRPAGKDWCWPVETVQVSAETVTATLGPVEE